MKSAKCTVNESECIKGKERQANMAQRMKVWFDLEGDFLEVTFSDDPGYMRATDNDAVMERVSERGKILGFSIMRVSRSRKKKPLMAVLS